MCSAAPRCHAGAMSTPSTERESAFVPTARSQSRPTRPGRVVDDLVRPDWCTPTGVPRRRPSSPRRSADARRAGRDAPPRLVEVAGYLGGALVVAALGLFLADSWVDLGDAGQVAALVVITLLLAGAGPWSRRWAPATPRPLGARRRTPAAQLVPADRRRDRRRRDGRPVSTGPGRGLLLVAVVLGGVRWCSSASWPTGWCRPPSCSSPWRVAR